ncbi:Peroxidase [Thalictrum thalictroides]|uniref:Peroxidase n=1 Tax=Thalictrum thalictroides TaxID=46969 RepID=A0A7J6VZ50_THATH|nr:Peroxidase [Thalictrum thalictroides]
MRSGLCFFCVTLVVLGFIEVCTGARLKLNFYRKTCPQFEKIVKNITWSRVASEPRIGAKLLRVHYHDCFVRGCDASFLLDSNATSIAEKEARPNLSVLGYGVIDDIKSRLEEVCPEIVSCGRLRCSFLSRAHTIGVSHCGVLGRRLFNFTGKGDTDPSIEPTYAEFLRTKCSNPTPATTIEMDPQGSLSFDSHYYRSLNF